MTTENSILKVQLSMVADDEARDELKAKLQTAGIELYQEDRTKRYELLRVEVPDGAEFEADYLHTAIQKMQTVMQAFITAYRQQEPTAGAFTIRVERRETIHF